MKRVLSLFLSCIFVLGVCFSTPIIASAAELTFEDDGNVFQYEENNECSIKKWGDTEVESLIVSDIVYDGDVPYTITGILSGAFSGCEKLESITIKSNIETIVAGAFAGCTALTEFIEDANSLNSNFEVDAGVLFNENQTTLIAYPAAKEGTEYTIPATVTEIATGAFADVSETFILEASDPTKITANPDGLVIHNVLAEDEQHTVNYGVSENAIKAKCFCGIDLETIAMIGYAGAFTDTNDKKWAKSATINAASEYTLSLDVEGVYNEDLSIETMNNSELSFWAKKGEGAAQKVTIDLGLELDSIAPTGTITLDENNIWTSLAETITFGLFFKDAKTVTIEANDAGSGVKSVEYCVSKEEIENIESANVVWKAYDSSIALSLLSKNIVYVRITDNVGNVRYISSNGIVLYSDSEADTESLETTYKSNENKDVTVKLNGNTINSVICDKGEFGVSNYMVDSDKIILKGEYLEKLSYGEYTYTVSYNPLGVDFVSGTNNSVPATTEFKVIVNKADITGATLPEAKTGLVYDGSEQSLVSAGSIEEGTVQYRLSENEDWSNTVPTGDNAGDYTVYYKISLDENYNDITGSIPVTIAEAASSVATAPTANELTYTGTEQELVTAGEATNGTMQYRLSENESWSTTIPSGINAKTYTVYYKVKGDLNYSDSDVASVVVTIGKAPVTLSVETQERVYDGTNAVEIKSATVSDVVSGETISVKYGGVTAISIDGTGVGTHIVDFKGDFELVGETAGNYEIGAVSGATVTITAKPLTITAKDATVVVNSVMPKFEYTVEGLVDSDSIANIEFVATVKNSSTVVENTATVGEYTLTPSAAVIKKGDTDVTENYKIEYVEGKFTVTVCTKHEWKNSKCEICKIDCEHKYEDGKSAISNKATTQATCVKEGVLLTQCKICDYKAESPLDIVSDAHKMSDWKETVKATCSSTGTEERVCELDCGHKETRPTEKDPDNHTYGDWVVTEATCVADGVKVKTCKNTECKHELKETIAKDPTAHKMAAEWEVTKKPTCVETGLQVKACLNAGCDHEVEEVIAIKADAHNLGGWVVTKVAKCTIPGEITRFCKNGSCEYKVTDSLDADGKNHDFAEDFTVIESTCVAKGSKYKVCQNPGCKVVSEKTEIAINPDAHKNIVTVNAKDATCETKGYTGDEFCNDCKKIIDPGIEINAKGHTESDWIVDKEPTFTEEGAKHTACIVCKKELKKEVIAKRALEVPEVKIENASNGIKVSWSQDEDATGYTVYSSTYNATTKKWSAWKNRGTAAATKSSWTDKTVSEGVTYRYTVRSVNGTNKSNYKATSGLCYVVAPKVTVSITSTGLLAKWNKVNNATSYIVYRRALVNGVWSSWVNLGSTKAEKNTWSDTSVQSGVTYRYTVRAVVGKVKSGYTASSSIIYLAQPLLKISNANTGITGKWDPIAGATGYTIYRSEYNPSTKKWSKWLTLGTTGATAKIFTDKTVKSGYEYKYTIRAVSGKFKSTYQDSNKLVYLAQPTLKISNVANGIQGKWSQVNGATGYIIYRRELKDGKWSNWTSLGTTKSTAKSFTDKTVKSGVTYSYTIRAKNGSYKSSYVSTGSLVFLSVPTVKISNGITGVNVSWSKIEGATSYLVYRRELVDGKWTKWAEFKTVSETSLVDETVKSGTNYRYTVRALNGKSRSMYTSTGTLYYLTAPTVTVEKVDGVVKVNWTQTVGAKGYTIYRAELGADGKWSKWVTLGTATEKYSSCKDKTAKTGVTYKYTVRAVNGKVKSAYVDGAQITNQ